MLTLSFSHAILLLIVAVSGSIHVLHRDALAEGATYTVAMLIWQDGEAGWVLDTSDDILVEMRFNCGGWTEWQTAPLHSVSGLHFISRTESPPLEWETRYTDVLLRDPDVPDENPTSPDGAELEWRIGSQN